VQYLSIEQIVELHHRVIQHSGGSLGLRDRGALESSVRQPLQSFGDQNLYPSLQDKAAALGYFLIQNHPFVDGNKRVGHAAMETLLLLNGFELSASVDEQEAVVLAVASGELPREAFGEWVRQHVVPSG
jgi:death-on-curing protein